MDKEISSSFDSRTIQEIDCTEGLCNGLEEEHDVYIQEHQSPKNYVEDQSGNPNSPITPRVGMEFSWIRMLLNFINNFL